MTDVGVALGTVMEAGVAFCTVPEAGVGFCGIVEAEVALCFVYTYAELSVQSRKCIYMLLANI